MKQELVNGGAGYSVGQWLDVWFQVYTSGLKPSTVVLYGEARRRLQKACPQIEGMPLDAMRPALFQEALNALDGRYAKSSIQHVKTLYAKAYRAAVQNRLCEYNPIPDAQVPREAPVKVVEGLSRREQEAFEAVLGFLPVVDHFLLQTFLLTGLRRGELLALKWEDWDQQRGLLRIRESKTASGVRTVPVIPEVAGMLCHLQYRARGAAKPSEYIFSLGGRPVGKDHLRHVCDTASRLAGIRHVTPHMLRHTFASRMIENGADPKSLSKIIGHANVAFTLHRYVNVDDAHLMHQMRLISMGRGEPR